MASNGGRYGPTYQAWRHTIFARAAATGDPRCGLCGQPVDLTLPYRNPRTGKVNGRSKSADHITPLANGGPPYDPANGQLAHLDCQRHQGGHIRANQEDPRHQARRRHRQRPNSRTW